MKYLEIKERKMKRKENRKKIPQNSRMNNKKSQTK